MKRQRISPKALTIARALTIAAMVAIAALAITGCERTPPPTAEVIAPPTPTPPVVPQHDIKPASGTIEATDAAVAQSREQIEQAAADMREQWRGKTFEEFEATVYKEPGEYGKYIVNGDIGLVDRKHLQEFFDEIQGGIDGTAHGKLILAVKPNEGAISINQIAGRDDIWSSAARKQLKYCVGNAFGARKATVMADMAAATLAWEEATDVDFIHVASEDGNCTANNPNVVFDVRPVDVDGEYLARAFFPNDQRTARNVLIDESSFQFDPSENLKLVGILRHELGHTLGFRHEHTRPESGTCFEDNEFKPLTSYDRFSVMHYPQCNGGGDWSLTLTGLDKAGSACIYGVGSNNTENLNQCLYRAPAQPTTGTESTETFDNQTVAEGDRKRYGPFTLKPGSLTEVRMSGGGQGAGDPDLYVRYVDWPSVNPARWICRPYLGHANEVCALEVPTNRNKIYVMVRGYKAGAYGLSVRYTRPD